MAESFFIHVAFCICSQRVLGFRTNNECLDWRALLTEKLTHIHSACPYMRSPHVLALPPFPSLSFTFLFRCPGNVRPSNHSKFHSCCYVNACTKRRHGDEDLALLTAISGGGEQHNGVPPIQARFKTDLLNELMVCSKSMGVLLLS